MHTTGEIEEKIRQRYHQPKGVEQFGIEPVPPELKTVRWHDYFRSSSGLPSTPDRSSSVGWRWCPACRFSERSGR
jgi:hypothetical protein